MTCAVHESLLVAGGFETGLALLHIRDQDTLLLHYICFARLKLFRAILYRRGWRNLWRCERRGPRICAPCHAGIDPRYGGSYNARILSVA